MYTAVDDTFRISVRNLVEFMCASGDIDNRDVSVPKEQEFIERYNIPWVHHTMRKCF